MRIKLYSNVCVGSLFDKCGILHKILKRKYHSNNYVDSKNITIPLLVAICKLDKFGPMINYPHMIDSEQNHFPQSFKIKFFLLRGKMQRRDSREVQIPTDNQMFRNQLIGVLETSRIS